MPDASRVQDIVYLAQNIPLTRTDPDYYALDLGNTVLAGGFYASRLSIDLRKTSGLVYSVEFRSRIRPHPQRLDHQLRLRSRQGDARGADRGRGCAQDADDAGGRGGAQSGEGHSPARHAARGISVNDIARGFAARRELNLPLDEPTIAARHYIALTPAQVQAAFRKYIRPDDLVRASEGPPPQ